MAKHKSIGERMRRASTLDVRKEIGLEWAADWTREYRQALSQLDAAVRAADLKSIREAVSAMNEKIAKRLDALPGVVERLADDDI